MQVYTLVGKSGSGKSFHAMELCKKKQIDGIIDDGLFIYQNTIVAGVSAKRSQTKIGAVKVALFLDSASCKEVKAAIEEKQPGSILVLGTSVEMVDKIIRRLGLPMPEADSPRRIRIEDITTEEERKVARQQRDKLGKHVIPAPALQLKHNFAGYFMDPLRLFRGKDQGGRRADGRAPDLQLHGRILCSGTCDGRHCELRRRGDAGGRQGGLRQSRRPAGGL